MISPADLDRLPPEVARPTYDRAEVTPGIAHLGVGGFHRSHQAMYLDRLLTSGLANDWGIVGFGLLPGDARMRDALRAQNHTYTLVLKHPNGDEEARVIGSIIDYVFVPDDPARAVERLADPAIRIVTLTLTEGGYNISPATGRFDDASPGVQHDVAEPTRPATAFGLVVEALRLRRERDVAPFTVLSCDNVAGNGHVARRAFTAFASLRDPELGEWIDANVEFPNSMVDRITPQTTEADRAHVATRYGIDDAWPVVAEPFTQWVIEDRFPLGRPAWDQVGAQLVDDVIPYELMKLRLLNASHQALAYFGTLMGYRWVHDAASDPLIARLLERYWSEEAIPTLASVSGVDLGQYTATLLERYRNPAIADTLARLCAETSDRIPTFLLPVAHAQVTAGGPVAMSAAVVASWARYAEGVDDHGAAIEVVDSRRERVEAAARLSRERPTSFLDDPELFGDLAARESFVVAYRRALDLLHTGTARRALEVLLA